MKRYFDKQQRSILAWVAGGSCKICKTKLTNDFHADHVIAFTNGGKTITKNGQALCKKCNLSKGKK
jgi:hypothetical protein